jgi:hypothetical protein
VKKRTLNEELEKISQIFNVMGMGFGVIKESLTPGPGPTALSILDGATPGMVKTLGSEIASQIETSILNTAKNSKLITQKLGKNVGDNLTFDDLKTITGGSTKSEIASNLLSIVGKSQADSILQDVADIVGNKNFKILERKIVGLEKIDKQLHDSVKKFFNSAYFDLSQCRMTQGAVDILEIQLPIILKKVEESFISPDLKDFIKESCYNTQLQLNTLKLQGQSSPISQNLPNIDSTDPQSYLNKYTKEELEKIHNSFGWKTIRTGSGVSSGWKFHVFGEDIKDLVYLTDALTPVIEKYGAHGKVGGTGHLSLDAFKPGGYQYGKQGVTIYIPVDVINSNLQKKMFEDIQTAISGYKKGGTISGDKALTPAIHYRYELLGPIDYKTGISTVSPGIDPITKKPLPSDYSNMYSKNEGGPYKPNDVPDIFDLPPVSIQTPPQKNTNFISNVLGDDSLIDWSKITNAKNSNDYNSLIKQALDTGEFKYISRGGFENYGIPDFRQYLKDKFIDDQGLTGNPGKPVQF